MDSKIKRCTKVWLNVKRYYWLHERFIWTHPGWHTGVWIHKQKDIFIYFLFSCYWFTPGASEDLQPAAGPPFLPLLEVKWGEDSVVTGAQITDTKVLNQPQLSLIGCFSSNKQQSLESEATWLGGNLETEAVCGFLFQLFSLCEWDHITSRWWMFLLNKP